MGVNGSGLDVPTGLGRPCEATAVAGGCRVGGDACFSNAPLRRHATLYAPCRRPAGSARPPPAGLACAGSARGNGLGDRIAPAQRM